MAVIARLTVKTGLARFVLKAVSPMILLGVLSPARALTLAMRFVRIEVR